MRNHCCFTLTLFPIGCFTDQLAPIRPDPKLTPGATFDVTLQDISEPGYSKKVRNVTTELKREVYPEYMSEAEAIRRGYRAAKGG